jgi:hypothetical protein
MFQIFEGVSKKCQIKEKDEKIKKNIKKRKNKNFCCFIF